MVPATGFVIVIEEPDDVIETCPCCELTPNTPAFANCGLCAVPDMVMPDPEPVVATVRTPALLTIGSVAVPVRVMPVPAETDATPTAPGVVSMRRPFPPKAEVGVSDTFEPATNPLVRFATPKTVDATIPDPVPVVIPVIDDPASPGMNDILIKRKKFLLVPLYL
jgi:hypothetical protein